MLQQKVEKLIKNKFLYSVPQIQPELVVRLDYNFGLPIGEISENIQNSISTVNMPHSSPNKVKKTIKESVEKSAVNGTSLPDSYSTAQGDTTVR